MGYILFFLYDIIFLTALMIYLPIGFLRKKLTLPALKEKLGLLPALNAKNSIWIHAVSVGEVMLIEALTKKLTETLNYPMVISVTTLTGHKLAREKYSSRAKIIFFPYDLSFTLEHLIKIISPKIFIAVETEIWPNLFFRLKKKNIPLIIANGRISHNAFKKYRLIKPFIKRVINKCNYVGVQDISYKNKFFALGCPEEKIVVSGNMKFESIFIEEKRLLEIKAAFSPRLLKSGRFLLIAASTHHPEEEIMLKIYKEIINAHPNLSLLIAPRHIERIPALERSVKSFGFNPVRLSCQDSLDENKKNVFLLDKIGMLLYMYSLGDICFVGGSLIPHGGQNILEPIYFLKPTLFGPHMDNFADIEDIVLSHGAGIKVSTPRELKDMILRLINDPALRKNLSAKCLEIFEKERMSLQKNLEIIRQCINK